MNFKSLLVSAAFLPMIAACATSTPYVPSVDGQYGYTETQIESNRWQVSFSGNTLTDLKTVQNYLLYRSAELASENGYDYFVVVDRKVDEDKKVQSTGFDSGPFHPAFSYRYYHPRFGWRMYSDPFFNDVTLREVKKYEAVAEIIAKKGDKPESDANAYNAKDVLTTLAPKIVRSVE